MYSLRILFALAFIREVFARPSGTEFPESTPTVPYASDNPNIALWGPDSDIIPEAMRGPLGATVIGPQNVELDLQNTDNLAPPTTDNGDVANFKWPFSLSHNRLQTGGWARQQNINQMPVATALAGVDMRLEAGAIRELHWHIDAEWAYVLKGDVRVSVVTPDGDVYLGDVSEGDLWYFPPGYPHSLQAKDTNPDGAEFLLIFDSGSFNEDSTFLLTDWTAHIPKEVLAKNFQLDEEDFSEIPSRELYIFPSSPPPADIEEDMVVPNDTPLPFTFLMSQMNATVTPDGSGSYKVVDSRLFPISTTVSVAEVTVEAGGMRELHWHPTQPEWTYFISGQGRITAFASSSNAVTMDFLPSDIAYIPPSYGHYVENTGTTTLKFLEIFNTDIFQDLSLQQWLALIPPDLVKAHLRLSEETISQFSQVKQVVVGPSSKQRRKIQEESKS